MNNGAYTLKQELNAHRISPREFADILGVPERHIKNILNGVTFVAPETINDYLRLLEEHLFNKKYLETF